MDWGIWFDKAWKGLITAVALGAIAYTVTTAETLAETPEVPVYVAALVPTALHLLGLANNYIKHADWLK